MRTFLATVAGMNTSPRQGKNADLFGNPLQVLVFTLAIAPVGRNLPLGL